MEFRYFRDLVYTDFLASILLELGFGGGTLFRFDTGQKGGSIILALWRSHMTSVIKNVFNGAFVAAIFVTGVFAKKGSHIFRFDHFQKHFLLLSWEHEVHGLGQHQLYLRTHHN